MTQLAYEKFCSVVASLSENMTAREVFEAVQAEYKALLSEITPRIQQNAIVNIRRNVIRRQAVLYVEGFGDLLEPYGLPRIIGRPKITSDSKKNSARITPDKLTLEELDALIEEERLKPPQKDRKLVKLEQLRSDLTGYCSPSETVETGLKRRKRG